MPETATTERDTKRTHKAIIAEAKKRLKDDQDRERAARDKCLDDLEFLAASPDEPAGQWGNMALAERARTNRPAMVINRMDQFVQLVSNAMKQNRVSARVSPVDDEADPETAKILMGVLRHIENNSGGTLAYDTAAFYAVAMGFGYYYLNTDYCGPMSFEQDIKIEPIKNQFQAYLGSHEKPDGSDAEHGFLLHPYTKEEYKEAFKNSKCDVSLTEEGWIKDDEILVVSYYCLEWRDDTLVELLDGSLKLRSELDDDFDDSQIRSHPITGEPNTRETRIPTCKFYKLNAQEVLSETEWPIPQIPIVKVTGHELNVEGKTIWKGIVRNLKDAQRMLNKTISDEAELLDSSKSQLMVADGQQEGLEDDYENLNKSRVVRYKVTEAAGHLVPPPHRLEPNMSLGAATQVRGMLAEDLKALAGIYDDALGAGRNDKSGKAILARQQQSDIANFHFQDNLTLSITHSTRMMVNLIPKIYDTPRVVRIIGEDDTQKVVKINQEFQEGKETRMYDFRVGKYDVVCSAGKSFSTKRQEGAEVMQQTFTAVPELFSVAGDLYFKAQDWAYSQDLADRAKHLLKPGIADQEEGQKVPIEVQQKMAEQSQMIEALTQAVNKLTDEKQAKQVEAQAKQQTEEMKQMFETQRLQMKLDSDEAREAFKAEIQVMLANMQASMQAVAEESKAAAQAM